MDKIKREGFRKEFNKTSAFGKGTYFAKNANYSINYSKQDKNGIFKMFQCRVICGESINGHNGYSLKNWTKKQKNGINTQAL